MSSGLIAAVYSNKSTRFGSHHYCLILKDSFRNKFEGDAVERLHVVFDSMLSSSECEEELYNSRNASIMQIALSNSAVLKVVQLIGHLRPFTILQSEVPRWFLGIPRKLSRAFKFTSRTSSDFIGAIARNYI